MLQLILGGAKSGKTTELFDRIKKYCEGEKKVHASDMSVTVRALLFVPEQFSFEAERELFAFLTPSLFRYVRVTSFSRFSEEIMREHGKIAGYYADDSAKTVVMSRAISQVADALKIYEKSAHHTSFAVSLLQTIEEFKHAALTPQELNETAKGLPDGYLHDKLSELSLLYGSYDALLCTSYLDPLDNILKASKIIEEKCLLSGYRLFFDEFKSFTAGEYRFLGVILKQALESVFSLCYSVVRDSSPLSPFAGVTDTYNRILRLAARNGIQVKPSLAFEESRFESKALAHLEANLFSSNPEVLASAHEQGLNDCTACICKNEYDEVDYVLSTIRLLITQGFRYNEIAILTRDMASYQHILKPAFEKYEIPYFEDCVESAVTKPLFRFVCSLLKTASGSYNTDLLLALMKCGLTPFLPEEVAMLENYTFIWEITGSRWREPFVSHPRGFVEEWTDEDKTALETCNRVREFAISAVEGFRKSTADANGREISAAVFELLLKIGAKEATEGKIEEALSLNDHSSAEEYERVWELLCELLSTVSAAMGDEPIPVNKYFELFRLAAGQSDIGRVPQAIDTVTVGGAERVRITGKKVVFVLGVNENVLPMSPTPHGVLTDQERKQLLSMDISLSKPLIEQIKEERFIAYKTITSPTQRLYLTARRGTVSGVPLLPSRIISEISTMFGEATVFDSEALSDIYYCHSLQSAFSRLAAGISEDTPLTASLMEVLNENTVYSKKVERLVEMQTTQRQMFEIKDKKTAALLFGSEMRISPTRVESFYRCRFRYFCEHGLRALPLKKAKLDPLSTGSLIHYLMEALLPEVSKTPDMPRDTIRSKVTAALDSYIETVMGGTQEKTARFLYLYHRMERVAITLIERLLDELAQSRFKPSAFEYKIDEGNEITPLILYGSGGTVVKIAGTIDRVDTYVNANGQTCVRIVDYKSGSKRFVLNDVLNGLNMQMLMYLHCIEKNGKKQYKDVLPAGILYMPASEQRPALPRDATDSDMIDARNKAYRMNGLLLNDKDLLEAMETPMNGVFIPVSVKKDGTFTKPSESTLISLAGLGKINRYMERLVIGMADELHQGHIEAVPLPDSCNYCNYKGVCGFSSGCVTREYRKLKGNDEVLENME